MSINANIDLQLQLQKESESSHLNSHKRRHRRLYACQERNSIMEDLVKTVTWDAITGKICSIEK